MSSKSKASKSRKTILKFVKKKKKKVDFSKWNTHSHHHQHNMSVIEPWIFILLARLRYYSLHMGFYVDYCVIDRIGDRWASVTLIYELISRVQSSGTLSPYQFHGAAPINWTDSPSIIVYNPLLSILSKRFITSRFYQRD